MKKKAEALDQVMREHSLPLTAMVYIGDDVNDVPLLRRVGLSATPSDACEEARQICMVTTRGPGGRGAVRELCELILKSQNRWDALIEAKPT